MLESPIVEGEARLATSQMMLTSEQHARLMEIYGEPDSDSSPELVRRKQRLAPALKREPLKANPNRRFPAPNPSDEGQLAFGFLGAPRRPAVGETPAQADLGDIL